MLVKIGNMFESKAATLVNTVNCVGVMGKGIAQEFKKRCPDMFKEYVAMCKNGEVKPGVPYLYKNMFGDSILNFPTKDHWRSPSKLSYILSGLDWFRNNYSKLEITSIAFPPLGCGNGGLSWTVVGPLMYSKLNDLPIDIEIYAPYGTAPEQLTHKFLTEKSQDSYGEIIGTQRSKLNNTWLLILYVIKKLNTDKYSLNVGRTIFQKICYLLTRTGVKTEFVFAKSQYGPYSTEAKQAIVALSNANLITERRLGSMVETIVSPDFKMDYGAYSITDIENAEKTYDLLSRISSTDQAEMIATVLFSYDELMRKNGQATEMQIYDYVVDWKPHWNEKRYDIETTIRSLSMLGWMKPDFTQGSFDLSDDWMY